MGYNRKIEDKKRNKSKGQTNYTRSKRFDASCRCNGGCKWCASNREHRINRMRMDQGE